MPLDLDTIEDEYQRDGVVRLRQLFAGEAMQRVRAELKAYLRERVPTLPAGDVVFEPDGQSVRNLFHMEAHSPYFQSLAVRPDLLELVGRLVRGQPRLRGIETFNKPAQVGTGVPPHQDNAYFCQSPPDVLTIWIAVDPVTEENGPVYYVPGSHQEGMRAHRPSGVKGNSIGLAEPFDKSNPFIGTLEPGDALIHHCQTIHYSAPNRSDRPRCGLLMVFDGDHVQTDLALKADYDKARAMV